MIVILPDHLSQLLLGIVEQERTVDNAIDNRKIAPGNNAVLVEQVIHEAQAGLFRYLSPFTGGPDGNGWPIGRDLHISEIYARLQRIAGVEYVEDVRVTTYNTDSPGSPIEVSPRLSMPIDGVLCSGAHRVEGV